MIKLNLHLLQFIKTIILLILIVKPLRNIELANEIRKNHDISPAQ